MSRACCRGGSVVSSMAQRDYAKGQELGFGGAAAPEPFSVTCNECTAIEKLI